MRVWRNWQTRKIQVLMIARLCRFKSCYPHQQKGIAPVAIPFCSCGGGAEPVRASGAGGRPSEARKCREAAPVTRTGQRTSGGAYRYFSSCPRGYPFLLVRRRRRACPRKRSRWATERSEEVPRSGACYHGRKDGGGSRRYCFFLSSISPPSNSCCRSLSALSSPCSRPVFIALSSSLLGFRGVFSAAAHRNKPKGAVAVRQPPFCFMPGTAGGQTPMVLGLCPKTKNHPCGWFFCQFVIKTLQEVRPTEADEGDEHNEHRGAFAVFTARNKGSSPLQDIPSWALFFL